MSSILLAAPPSGIAQATAPAKLEYRRSGNRRQIAAHHAAILAERKRTVIGGAVGRYQRGQ